MRTLSESAGHLTLEWLRTTNRLSSLGGSPSLFQTLSPSILSGVYHYTLCLMQNLRCGKTRASQNVARGPDKGRPSGGQPRTGRRGAEPSRPPAPGPGRTPAFTLPLSIPKYCGAASSHGIVVGGPLHPERTPFPTSHDT